MTLAVDIPRPGLRKPLASQGVINYTTNSNFCNTTLLTNIF